MPTVSQDKLIGMHLVVDLLDNRPLAKAMAEERFSRLLYQSIEKGSVMVYELQSNCNE
jgi:hypothetical protein